MLRRQITGLSVRRPYARGSSAPPSEILDEFSRAVVGWRLKHKESALAAVRMLQDTIQSRGQAPEVLYADRG